MANRPGSRRAIEKTQRGIIYAILIVVSVIWLFPFVYLIFQSLFKVPVSKNFFPGAGNWTFDNYINLFTNDAYPFLKWWLNTFIIAVFTSLLQTVFVLMTAYALSRLKFNGRQGLMKLMLILGMFPGFLGMLVIFYILELLGLNTSIFSLILVYVASSAMSYYIAKGFFDTVSKSLDEAVLIDGGTKNTVFWKVILPLSKPIIIYTILVSFTGPWGDFMFGRYIVTAGSIPASGWTVAVGLQLLTTKAGNLEYGLFCAGAVMVSIPITALFFWLQRYYVEGIAGGAVKG
ncbi:MAG: ABC transporter permease subunit [Bacilli bacterium]|nr:ABC transporter permease subunit [Bacilli bacterium]